MSNFDLIFECYGGVTANASGLLPARNTSESFERLAVRKYNTRQTIPGIPWPSRFGSPNAFNKA